MACITTTKTLDRFVKRYGSNLVTRPDTPLATSLTQPSRSAPTLTFIWVPTWSFWRCLVLVSAPLMSSGMGSAVCWSSVHPIPKQPPSLRPSGESWNTPSRVECDKLLKCNIVSRLRHSHDVVLLILHFHGQSVYSSYDWGKMSPRQLLFRRQVPPHCLSCLSFGASQ